MAIRGRLMKWVLIAGGVLVGIPALLALIGSFLPRDHVAQMALSLQAGPKRVWALVADFAGTARWRPEVTDVAVQPAGEGRVRFIEATGRGKTPFEVLEQRPASRQVVRVVDDGLPFGGTWTWELTPADRGGTRLVITEAGFVRNPIFRALGRLFFPPTATMRGYLTALAKELGESREPELLRAR